MENRIPCKFRSYCAIFIIYHIIKSILFYLCLGWISFIHARKRFTYKLTFLDPDGIKQEVKSDDENKSEPDRIENSELTIKDEIKAEPMDELDNGSAIKAKPVDELDIGSAIKTKPMDELDIVSAIKAEPMDELDIASEINTEPIDALLDIKTEIKLEPDVQQMTIEGMEKRFRQRRKRTPYNRQQLLELEKEFKIQQFVHYKERCKIASTLALTELQVRMGGFWFVG